MPDVAYNDHDLLIELRTEMRGLRSDVKELKDGTTATLVDHENRMRVLEGQGNKLIGFALISQIVLIPLGFFFLSWLSQ